MDLSLLDELKDRLIRAKDFASVLTYFFDHFGESPEFMALGERFSAVEVKAAVKQICRTAFGGMADTGYLIFTRLDEPKFVHGGGPVDGRMTTVFYFEEELIGLAAISAGGGETKLVRFGTRPQPFGPRASAN